MNTMNLRQQVAKRLIHACDPHAFDEGTLLAEVEQHEARLASDPAVQRRKEDVRQAVNREYLPVLIIGILVNAVLYGAASWYLPGFVTPPFAAIAFLATSILFWRTVRQ